MCGPHHLGSQAVGGGHKVRDAWIGASQQMRQARLRAKKTATAIDLLHQIKTLHRGIQCAAQINRAGVVDEDVDAAKRIQRRRDCGAHLVFFTNIVFECQRAATGIPPPPVRRYGSCPAIWGWRHRILAAIATFAPSCAARNAIAKPIREAPVMNNRVLPASVLMPVSCLKSAWKCKPAAYNSPMHSAWFDATLAWIAPTAGRGRAGVLDRVLRCHHHHRCDCACATADDRDWRVDWHGRIIRPVCGQLRGAGCVPGRWFELLDRPPLGRIATRGLAVQSPPWPTDRGENLFRRNAFKSIFIARYVGAVRPFVPAIAGMLKMPLLPYFKASGLACVSWAILFLLPGRALGQAYDAVAAVADKLLLVLLGLLAALALAWAVVLYTWRWFALNADSLLARTLRWIHAHPRLRRHVGALIDRRRPETAPLVLLALCLFAVAWLWTWFSVSLLAGGRPTAVDHEQAPMPPCATRWQTGPWPPWPGLAARRCWGWHQPRHWHGWQAALKAALHWLAAIAIGLGLTEALDAVIDMPRPPLLRHCFGFPIGGHHDHGGVRFFCGIDRPRTAGPAAGMAIFVDRRGHRIGGLCALVSGCALVV